MVADIQPGQVYVPGSNSKTARALLAAAAKAGLDPKVAVRTTDGGFVVPDAVAKAHAKTPAKHPAKRKARTIPVDPPPEQEPAPRGRKKPTKEG